VACILLALVMVYGYSSRRKLVRLALVTVVGFVIAVQMRASLAEGGLRLRNFYGTLEVADGSGAKAMRTLYNGAIVHGSQFLALGTGRIPTTYYGPRSGAGIILSRPGPPRRVGVIGLGAGTLAAYGRAGDYYRFYEINPAVVWLAREKFRYLYECPAKWEVITGDGRLSLEREPDQRFDVLVLDAFTGDSIPLHMLSREAFALYGRHLAPGGVLAVHVSNKYLDLVPVLARLSEAAGREAMVVRSPADAGGATNDATWVLAGDSASLPGERVQPARGVRLWTDDYSNLLHALK
jgi:SAM-dependent methyltransferase